MNLDDQRDEYIAQRLHDVHDRDEQLQIAPTLLGLVAIVVLFLGQPVVAGIMLLVAVLLSAGSAGAARADAALAVDVYMEGRPDRERVVGHYAIGCVLLLVGVVLIIGMTVVAIGLTLDDPWLIGGVR
jgi:hypothetical protein